jgi:hypothetical protein
MVWEKISSIKLNLISRIILIWRKILEEYYKYENTTHRNLKWIEGLPKNSACS